VQVQEQELLQYLQSEQERLPEQALDLAPELLQVRD
jgi:hypothetical protein